MERDLYYSGLAWSGVITAKVVLPVAGYLYGHTKLLYERMRAVRLCKLSFALCAVQGRQREEEQKHLRKEEGWLAIVWKRDAQDTLHNRVDAQQEG